MAGTEKSSCSQSAVGELPWWLATCSGKQWKLARKFCFVFVSDRLSAKHINRWQNQTYFRHNLCTTVYASNLQIVHVCTCNFDDIFVKLFLSLRGKTRVGSMFGHQKWPFARSSLWNCTKLFTSGIPKYRAWYISVSVSPTARWVCETNNSVPADKRLQKLRRMSGVGVYWSLVSL